jgi:hypothetical protein
LGNAVHSAEFYEHRRADPRYMIELRSGVSREAIYGRSRRIVNLRIEKEASGA